MVSTRPIWRDTVPQGSFSRRAMTTSERTALISAWMLVGWLAGATPSAAQIYKWTDASGTIHFSDSPPPRTQGNPAV